MKKVIHSDVAPEVIGPFSQAIKANGLLFVTGQIPMDYRTGEVIEGGIEEQTRQSMNNLKAILEAAGTDFDHIVKSTVYLKDIDDFVIMNTVYAQYFKLRNEYPARVCVEVSNMPKGALVQIDAIASYGSYHY